MNHKNCSWTKFLLWIFVVSAWGGLTGSVYAACVVQGAAANATVNFGNFPNPNQSSATGEDVGAPVTLNFVVACHRTSAGQAKSLLHFASGAAAGRRAGSFATGIDGLDMDVTLNVGPVQTTTQVRSLDYVLDYSNGDDVSVNVSYTFQLKKSLAKVAVGIPLLVSNFAEATYQDEGTGGSAVTLLTVNVRGNPVQAVGCSVAPGSNQVTVQLPSISTLSLSGTGATAGRTSFSLLLQCGDARTDVYIALTDANQPANTSSVLTLDASSSALNVGVNLLRADGGRVKLGPETAGLGSASQWFAGSMTGAGAIELSAEYVATGQPVVAGTVRASALFNLMYQ
ncbi:fimbrial protein [Achromobacter marplatensis]|uniref:fimbrial protein n=1 Tax=Achromobacter marplatensis TaxID=470868 RepID=UPI0039F6640D